MELDEVNKGQIKRYLVFVKGKRERHLRELDLILQDIKDDRGGESIYNQADVLSLLDEFHSMNKDLVRAELEHLGNMSALYATDLYQQSQSNGLQLCGDVSAIEEESRLQKVAELADWNGTAALPTKKLIGGLASLGGSGSGGSPVGSEEANKKIEVLSEENGKLNERYMVMQKQVAELLKERSSLSSELVDLKSQFATVKSQLSSDMQNNSSIRDMESQLTSAKDLLESKNSEINTIKEDMSKRLIDSNQFKDMKNILQKKNVQIKDLRERLRKYEDPDGGEDMIRED